MVVRKGRWGRAGHRNLNTANGAGKPAPAEKSRYILQENYVRKKGYGKSIFMGMNTTLIRQKYP